MSQPSSKQPVSPVLTLKRRYWLVLAILVCFIIAGAAGWQLWPEDLFYPQLRPAMDALPASIVIGENGN